jgi:hypothetical protein
MSACSSAIVASEASGKLQRRIGSMILEVLAAENTEVESTNSAAIHRIDGAH